METYYVVLVDDDGFVIQRGPSYNSYDRAELDARYRNQERDDGEYRWTVYDSYDFVNHTYGVIHDRQHQTSADH